MFLLLKFICIYIHKSIYTLNMTAYYSSKFFILIIINILFRNEIHTVIIYLQIANLESFNLVFTLHKFYEFSFLIRSLIPYI